MKISRDLRQVDSRFQTIFNQIYIQEMGDTIYTYIFMVI